MLGDERNPGRVFTSHLGVSHVLIDREDEKGQKERHLVLAAKHIHSQCEVASFGDDNCDEAGTDATQRWLKSPGPPLGLSSYVAKNTHRWRQSEWGVGWERPS